MAVWVKQLRQDPAEAGLLHAGVRLAKLVQPGSQIVDRGQVRDADREVIEAGGGSGSVRVEAQADRGASVWMLEAVAHQLALFDELGPGFVSQPTVVPVAGPGQVGHR